jgi:hypothetical protein
MILNQVFNRLAAVYRLIVMAILHAVLPIFAAVALLLLVLLVITKLKGY